MLVLSRKVDQKFYINVPGRDKPIEVTIVKIERAKTRVGIDADPDITVVRQELIEEADEAAEARRAAKLSP